MRSSPPVSHPCRRSREPVWRGGRGDRRDPARGDPEFHGGQRGIRADEALAVRTRVGAGFAKEAGRFLGSRPDDPGAPAPRGLHGEHADAAGRAANQHGIPGVHAAYANWGGASSSS